MTAPIVCVARCWTCGAPLTDKPEGWCSYVCERTTPVLRWACTCGRFIAQSSIDETDHRDDTTYYGIRTDTRYSCSRCGTVEGEPRLVEVGTMIIPADEYEQIRDRYSVTLRDDAIDPRRTSPIASLLGMTRTPVDNST